MLHAPWMLVNPFLHPFSFYFEVAEPGVFLERQVDLETPAEKDACAQSTVSLHF